MLTVPLKSLCENWTIQPMQNTWTISSDTARITAGHNVHRKRTSWYVQSLIGHVHFVSSCTHIIPFNNIIHTQATEYNDVCENVNSLIASIMTLSSRLQEVTNSFHRQVYPNHRQVYPTHRQVYPNLKIFSDQWCYQALSENDSSTLWKYRRIKSN